MFVKPRQLIYICLATVLIKNFKTSNQFFLGPKLRSNNNFPVSLVHVTIYVLRYKTQASAETNKLYFELFLSKSALFYDIVTEYKIIQNYNILSNLNYF